MQGRRERSRLYLGLGGSPRPLLRLSNTVYWSPPYVNKGALSVKRTSWPSCQKRGGVKVGECDCRIQSEHLFLRKIRCLIGHPSLKTRLRESILASVAVPDEHHERNYESMRRTAIADTASATGHPPKWRICYATDFLQRGQNECQANAEHFERRSSLECTQQTCGSDPSDGHRHGSLMRTSSHEGPDLLQIMNGSHVPG
jgi:hypothetical protein